MKIFVDAAAGGDLMEKSIDAVKALLEEMIFNNYHWSSERSSQGAEVTSMMLML